MTSNYTSGSGYFVCDIAPPFFLRIHQVISIDIHPTTFILHLPLLWLPTENLRSQL
jgi:hypothetical protein